MVDMSAIDIRKSEGTPQTVVHTTGSKPPVGYTPQPDYIVFNQADASWVQNPHEDALVIIPEVTNNLVH